MLLELGGSLWFGSSTCPSPCNAEGGRFLVHGGRMGLEVS